MRCLVICAIFAFLSLIHCQNGMDTTIVQGNDNAIHFSKRLYSSLGALSGWNATSLAEGGRKEFDNLNTDGMLGSALQAFRFVVWRF